MANEIEVNLKKSVYGSEALVDSLLVQILILINRKLLAQNQELDYISIMPAMIKETIDYINSHITEEISVQKLSGQIGYNPDYLCRIFKSITGFSLQHYIKARQISLAKKLLREGRPAYDVCFMTGFNNYSNFSRTFKNYENLSPKKYQMLQNLEGRQPQP
jgi:AraC-like DNA-binding protein